MLSVITITNQVTATKSHDFNSNFSADNDLGSLKTLKTKVIANSTGYSEWFAVTTIKATCRINVKYFPFDQQICYLTFG